MNSLLIGVSESILVNQKRKEPIWTHFLGKMIKTGKNWPCCCSFCDVVRTGSRLCDDWAGSWHLDGRGEWWWNKGGSLICVISISFMAELFTDKMFNLKFWVHIHWICAIFTNVDVCILFLVLWGIMFGAFWYMKKEMDREKNKE